MYLVYRALENEPVPMVLPPPLVPPSKRKKVNSPPVMPLLPSPPSLKERSSTHSGSQTLPSKPTPPQVSSHLIVYSLNPIWFKKGRIVARWCDNLEDIPRVPCFELLSVWRFIARIFLYFLIIWTSVVKHKTSFYQTSYIFFALF